MKSNQIIFLLFAVIFSIGLIIIRDNINKKYGQIKDHQIIEIEVAGQVLKVEVVNTPLSSARGLSGRDEIGSDGMLFILPQRKIAQFWMKDMRFDIDIIWIDEGKIIGWQENVPKPEVNTSLDKLLIYSPDQPIEMVLELPAESIKKHQFIIGDSVLFKF